MKKIITLLLLVTSIMTYAQPKMLSQAIVTTKTTVIAPEDDEDTPAQIQTNNGEEVHMVRFNGDGESKSTTWLKNDLVKTLVTNDMGRTTTIRDNDKKITTTLMEIMGRKSGFYATDEEQETMRKQMDSLMQGRRQNDGQFNNTPPTTDVVYVEETKKIAGIVCKKALLITTKPNGNKDSASVWYCPDFKLKGITSTGGMGGGFGTFMRPNSNTAALSKIDGFVMQYEMKMNRGRRMIVEVTKIETDKELADKEFEIPKDFDVKPMKDMQSGGGPGGGIQIRIGG